MRIVIRVEEDTFHTGKVSEEKTDPPVIEYIDKDGWQGEPSCQSLISSLSLGGRIELF